MDKNILFIDADILAMKFDGYHFIFVLKKGEYKTVSYRDSFLGRPYETYVIPVSLPIVELFIFDGKEYPLGVKIRNIRLKTDWRLEAPELASMTEEQLGQLKNYFTELNKKYRIHGARDWYGSFTKLKKFFGKDLGKSKERICDDPQEEKRQFKMKKVDIRDLFSE